MQFTIIIIIVVSLLTLLLHWAPSECYIIHEEEIINFPPTGGFSKPPFHPHPGYHGNHGNHGNLGNHGDSLDSPHHKFHSDKPHKKTHHHEGGGQNSDHKSKHFDKRLENKPVIETRVISRSPGTGHYRNSHANPELRYSDLIGNSRLRRELKSKLTKRNENSSKKIQNLKLEIPSSPKLEVYNYASEEDGYMISNWYCSTINKQYSEKEGMAKLKAESCTSPQLHNKPGMIKSNFSMCEAYKKIHGMYESGDKKCFPPLTEAECYAVTMYSSDFYAEYNPNIRKGFTDSYEVFTNLLFSALKKLDNMPEYSVPDNTKLYKGMRLKFDAPDSKRYYFKNFVSTTTDKEVAKTFGTDTLIVFSHKAPVIAANIKDLSMFSVEEEVLLVPFEAFETMSQKDDKDGKKIIELKTSPKQEIMDMKEGECKVKKKPKHSGAAIHLMMKIPLSLLVATMILALQMT